MSRYPVLGSLGSSLIGDLFVIAMCVCAPIFAVVLR